MSKLIRPTDNYTMIDNGVLKDRELSMRAKGLYCIMFSKPDGWAFIPAVLMNESREGRDAFNAAMDELIDRGWVVKQPVRDKQGRFMHNDYELRITSNWKPVDGKTVNGESASSNIDISNTEVSKTVEVLEKKTKETKNATRGQRLEQYLESNPNEPYCPSEWYQFCYEQYGWTPERANSVFDTFRDYWRAAAGAKGVKADWPATWRNWCRREAKNSSRSRGNGGGTGDNLSAALRTSVASRYGATRTGSEERGGQRAGEADADAGGAGQRLSVGEIPF